MASRYGWGPGYGIGGKPKKLPHVGGGAFGWGPGYGIGGHPNPIGQQQSGSGGYGSGANQLPGVSGVGQGPPIQPQDPFYQAYLAQQGLNLGLSDAEATYQRGNLGYETGYNAQGAQDYTNPYSAAALLEENYKRSRAGTLNSYASQGQLNSGAYGRMQDENARRLSIGSSDLQHAAANAYHGIDVGQASNAIQYGSGTQSESLLALLKALGVG